MNATNRMFALARYYKLISTMTAEEAFRPMDQGECPMVTKKN